MSPASYQTALPRRIFIIKKVLIVGLEPTPKKEQILSLPRLPISPNKLNRTQKFLVLCPNIFSRNSFTAS